MEKVKLGFLGCGYMGQNAHMRNYYELDDCEIVAVCDGKRQQAEAVARRYNIPTVYTDYRELLANPEIDAIVAAQPFDNHVNLVPAILGAGKHLLTEKALCVFPEHGDALARIARESGKVYMVAYHKRSDPATEYALDVMREWNATGNMGKLKYVRICMPPGDWIGGADKVIQTNEPVISDAPESNPEGVDEDMRRDMFIFVNYYIHQVNLLHLLLGEDYSATYADPSGVLLAAQSASGVPGLIEMSPYATTDEWQENALICYEKGWIRIDLVAPLAAQRAGRVTVFENDKPMGITRTPALPNISAMRNQAKNFLKAVRGEKPAPCDASAAAFDLHIAKQYLEMYKH